MPLHFTAFHPDWKMQDRPATPPETLTRARRIALAEGLHHVYTGNVHDPEGQSTYCSSCGAIVIERDGYRLGDWRLAPDGGCLRCGATLPGRLRDAPGDWGSHRQPVRLAAVR